MKELIEKLKEQARPKNQHHTHASISLNDLQILLNAIEERWIPVTERLPKNGQEFIAFLKKTETNWLQHDAIVKSHVLDSRATHWMPLPTPPKG